MLTEAAPAIPALAARAMKIGEMRIRRIGL
jgi:hypothetical protein